jgi:hypothetical protein
MSGCSGTVWPSTVSRSARKGRTRRQPAAASHSTSQSILNLSSMPRVLHSATTTDDTVGVDDDDDDATDDDDDGDDDDDDDRRYDDGDDGDDGERPAVALPPLPLLLLGAVLLLPAVGVSATTPNVNTILPGLHTWMYLGAGDRE